MKHWMGGHRVFALSMDAWVIEKQVGGIQRCIKIVVFYRQFLTSQSLSLTLNSS